MRVVVTGGAGFIGSHYVRTLLSGGYPAFAGADLVVLDLLTYAGTLTNLTSVRDDPRLTLVEGDICDAALVDDVLTGADLLVHFAAESHVDRSILSGADFVRTNVLGTQTLLAAALEAKVGRFVHVSTDEVYGSLPWVDPADPDPNRGFFTEESPLAPRSPYAASKAGSDMLALAYHHTHGLDVVVTRCSNNYGPFQFPEKLIPLMATNALEGARLPVYGDGLHVRDWIHVEDHCEGVIAAMDRGSAGEVYNFGGNAERTNLQVVHGVIQAVGCSPDLIRRVEDRPGHDRRYAVDAGKAAEALEWTPRMDFEEGLVQTVDWYRENEAWWQRVKSGEYRKYYRRRYGTKDD